ncbi:MAG: hypothetical protein ACQEP1_01270 [Nanobdellota archaeon]
MKLKSVVVVFVFIFSISLASAGSSLQTSLTPDEADMCGGPDPDTLNMTAEVTNDGTENLSSVDAELVIGSGTGISVNTSNPLSLGDMDTGNSTTVNWTISCDESQSGDHVLYLNYSTAGSYSNTSIEENDEFSEITVNTCETPVVEDMEPSGTVTRNDVELKVNTDMKADCRYDDENVSYSIMTGRLNGSDEEYTDTQSLEEGDHEFYVSCENGYSSCSDTMDDPEKLYFEVDTNSPEILSSSPTGEVSESFTLEVETNENATCRYSSSSGEDYGEMEKTMDSVDSLDHKQDMSITSDGSYTYYVKCKDNHGNEAASDHAISFTVDSSPVAEITLSDHPPVNPGVIQVDLVTSEKVVSAPKLTYELHDDEDEDNPTRTVPLSGSGRFWEGEMIIYEDDLHKVGEFSYSATDYSGNVGNSISSGKSFLVDTLDPEEISEFEGESREDGSIKLEWYNDDDENSYFNIYRATVSDVDKLDHYAESTDEDFEDQSTELGEEYYYRVSSVDTAGNEGELSETISVVSKAENETEVSSSTGLDSEYVPLVDERIERINELLIDLENEASSFNEGENKDLAETVDLSSEVESIREELKKYKGKVKELKDEDLSKSELDLELNKLDMKIDTSEKNIPESIELVQEMDKESSPTSSDVKEAANDLINLKRMTNIDEDVKEKYIKNNQEFQSDYEVGTNLQKIEVEYLGGSSKEIINVEKSIKGNPGEGYSLVEKIPKELASKVDNIEFGNENYDIIKRDPKVRWVLEDVPDNSLSYYVESEEDLSSIGGIKSMIMEDINDYVETNTSDEENKTDSPEEESSGFLDKIMSWEINSSQIGIIIGVLLIIGLSVYYFFYLDQDDNTGRKKEEMLNGYVSQKEAGKRENQRNVQPVHNDPGPGKEQQNQGMLQEEINELYNQLQVTNIRNLLQEAHMKIDKGRNKEAEKLMDEILVLYKYLPEKQKHIVSSETEELSNRLDRKGNNGETEQVSGTRPLQFVNGAIASDLLQLLVMIDNMEEDVFRYHVNQYRNDIGEWVGNSMGKKELSRILMRLDDREEMERVLLNYLKSERLNQG